jgi:secreted trypsin-like serine protease
MGRLSHRAGTCAARALLGAGMALALAGAPAMGRSGTPTQPPASPSAKARIAVIGGARAITGTLAPVAEILDSRGSGLVAQCTGTVVAPRLILTAAHCAESVRTGARYAAAGFQVMTGSLSWAAPARQVSAVSAALVYQGFNRRLDAGDAALLVLSTPTTAPAVRLAGVPPGGFFPAGEPALIAGWGITSYAQSHPTEALRSARTVVQARSWCARNAPPFFAHTELCVADPPSFRTGGCSGDSGGPLLAADPAGGEPVEIGIAVHVYGRCSTRRPTVYQRADAIAAWAQSWITAYAQPPAPAPQAPPPPASAPAPAPGPGPAASGG